MAEMPDQDPDAPEGAEADETEADETGLEPTSSRRTPRPWKSYARRGLIAAAFGGVFGIAGFLGWKLWEQHTLDEAGQTARDAAVNYAEVLTSIDSNNLDQNFAEVLNGSTGEFKDMYTKESVRLRQLLIENKATAHGVVVDSAIQSESKDEVVLLLLVDQTVSNSELPDPRVTAAG